MLSLREFCIALYLMERHRQGSTLPKSLPDSLRYDEALLQATGLPAAAYAGPTWQQNPGNHSALLTCEKITDDLREYHLLN